MTKFNKTYASSDQLCRMASIVSLKIQSVWLCGGRSRSRHLGFKVLLKYAWYIQT